MCYGVSLSREPGSSHDTVGAVALDIDGRVAFATSTGGIAARRLGRVGDSPLIGQYKCIHTLFIIELMLGIELARPASLV